MSCMCDGGGWRCDLWWWWMVVVVAVCLVYVHLGNFSWLFYFLVGNGDIMSFEDYYSHLESSSISGIMIARSVRLFYCM